MRIVVRKQHKPTMARISARLEERLVQTLEHYCQFKESERDYVLGEVLSELFTHDKEFIAWCQSNGIDAMTGEASGTSHVRSPREARASA